MIPGEYKLSNDPVPYNAGRESIQLKVKNVGDRAVQVGSHFHFYEANEEGLRFDREKAYGYHLDIPSGTSVRFEPGEEKEVTVTEIGGSRRIFGLNDLTCTQATEVTKKEAVEKAKRRGFIR